jgi:hypothetical protein
MSAQAPQAAPRDLIDVRIARTGGTRTDRKRASWWSGMMHDSTWRRTDVHTATSMYGCAFCGAKFSGPAATYTHIDKRHPKRGRR